MEGETSAEPAAVPSASTVAEKPATEGNELSASNSTEAGPVVQPPPVPPPAPVVNPPVTETSIILRPTISTVTTTATTTPTATAISVVNATGSDLGGQQYYVVVGADGTNSLVAGIPAGITNATSAQIQGTTVIGTVVGSTSRPGTTIPTANIIAQGGPVTIKRGTVRPGTLTTKSAPVLARAAVSIPKGHTIVPRAGQVVPGPAGTSATSGIVKMITVPALGSTAGQSTVSVYLPGPSAATATPLVRRASPTKAVPIKTITQPVQAARTVFHARPTVAAPAATTTAAPVVAAVTTSAPTTSTTTTVTPVIAAKKPAATRVAPTAAGKTTVAKPAAATAAARVLTNKNTTSADRAAQYRKAIGDSMMKLHKLETSIMKLNPDKATPFTVGEIFTQTAASFAKMASLTSHLSLDSQGPADKRRWSPELVTKFITTVTTFATSMKEIGDELKGRHEKQLIGSLKRKAETEGSAPKKTAAVSILKVPVVSAAKNPPAPNENLEPLKDAAVKMPSTSTSTPVPSAKEPKAGEEKVDETLATETTTSTASAASEPPTPASNALDNTVYLTPASEGTPQQSHTMSEATSQPSEKSATVETLETAEREKLPEKNAVRESPSTDIELGKPDVTTLNDLPVAENVVISEGIVEEGELVYGKVSKVVTLGLSFFQTFLEEAAVVESQKYGPEIIDRCSPVIVEQILESFLNNIF
ncbi:mucin-2-like [Paramacrobiotus metropolitanus]|uniref:mucin-2-like n=1 Tax=Paramacrobiotus metropolitanus TaxID=2943436 RepID=UPI002445FB58|nr:mucin-2-like [Paramacrobiotus metropolitanus]